MSTAMLEKPDADEHVWYSHQYHTLHGLEEHAAQLALAVVLYNCGLEKAMASRPNNMLDAGAAYAVHFTGAKDGRYLQFELFTIMHGKADYVASACIKDRYKRAEGIMSYVKADVLLYSKYQDVIAWRRFFGVGRFVPMLKY